MSNYENLLPNILTITCWIIEMVAFLTSYMIESRSLKHLHDGIFYRCVYPMIGNSNSFRCLWWSNDTFWIDPGKLNGIQVYKKYGKVGYSSLYLLSVHAILYMLGLHFAYLHGLASHF